MGGEVHRAGTRGNGGFQLESTAMAKPKLTYFDFSASRGEECRLAFSVAGVDFEDNRVKREDWPALKATLPFRSMPVLELEGKPPLSQANAILRLIGRKYGLLPIDDDWECARIESIMDAAEDIRGKVSATMSIKDPEEQKRTRAELSEGALKSFGECIEAQIQGPFVSGEKISVADIKLFVVVGWIKKGVLDHISAELFDGYPKISALFTAVTQHPSVVAWNTRTVS